MEIRAKQVKGEVTSRTLRPHRDAAPGNSLRGADEIWCELGGRAIGQERPDTHKIGGPQLGPKHLRALTKVFSFQGEAER